MSDTPPRDDTPKHHERSRADAPSEGTVIYADFAGRRRLTHPPATQRERDARAPSQPDNELKGVWPVDPAPPAEVTQLRRAGDANAGDEETHESQRRSSTSGEYDGDDVEAGVRRRPSLAGKASMATALYNLLMRHGERKRYERGRAYAREGRVLETVVTNRRIRGKVKGSQNEPFHPQIILAPRSVQEADRCVELMDAEHYGQPMKRSQAGKIPQLSEELLGLLLCRPQERCTTRCDCPDPASVCKHVAALAVSAAQMFSDRPQMIALLCTASVRTRGRDHRPAGQASGSPKPREHSGASDEAKDDSAAHFWQGMLLPELPEPPAVPSIEESDLQALQRAMRLVSYVSADELRAVSDIEDMFEFLTE